MAQQVIGLDMDQERISGVILEASARGSDWHVVKIFERDLPNVKDEDGNPRTLVQRQKPALHAVAEESTERNATLVTAFSTQQAGLCHLSFPFNDQRKIAAVLPGMLETEVPFDVEDLAVSWRLHQSGQKLAPGEEVNVMVGFAKRDKVAQHLGLWEETPLVPRHIRHDAQALSALYPWIDFGEVYDTSEPEPGLAPLDGVPAVGILELGFSRTRICMMKGDEVLAARTIGRGFNEAVAKVSQHFGISHKEAKEAIEREAFIEVRDASASFANQKTMSDLIKMALHPIVREIRQTFQSLVSSHKARITRVCLTGPGSGIRNVVPYLSESLQVEVSLMTGMECLFERLSGIENPIDAKTQAQLARTYALPLALAISGQGGDHNRRHTDFRVGEFAWKGELDFVRDRMGAIALWMFLLCLLVAGNGMTRSILLGQRSGDLSDRQVEACKKITGQSIGSTSRCMGIIREQINQGGEGGTVQKSAVDSYVEIALRMPSDIQVKITELDIKPGALRMKGESGQFDEVDKIVSALQKGRCFTNVEKGKARKLKEGVAFQVSMNLDCEANPGTPLEKGKKAAPKKPPTPPTPGPPKEAKKPMPTKPQINLPSPPVPIKNVGKPPKTPGLNVPRPMAPGPSGLKNRLRQKGVSPGSNKMKPFSPTKGGR